MTIQVDCFTLAHPDYPVDCRVKSVPATPVSAPMWGTVTRNSDGTFDVIWDFAWFKSTHSTAEQLDQMADRVGRIKDNQ